MRHRPEARLEVDVLLELGSDPEFSLYTNPEGEGYYGCILPQIRQVLQGSAYLDAVLQILFRNRVTYGLGVGSPDIVAIGRGGTFCGLELKAGTVLSSAQIKWHAAARARGARVGEVQSVGEGRQILTG